MASETADKSLQKVLKDKGEATVAIFDRGDYYGCYGDDAVLLANEVFRSDICMRKITLNVPTASEVQYIAMGYGQYQRVVRELILILRYRVELYVLEDGKWNMKAKGTVGNTGDFDDVIGDVVSSGSTVMALSITDDSNYHVTASFWDTDSLRVTTTEFHDTNTFSQTEQCIVAMNPRECLLVSCEIGPRRKTLNNLLQRTNVMITQFKMDEKVNDEQVKVLFRSDALDFGSLSEGVKQLLRAQYHYLNMKNQATFFNKFSVNDYKTSGFLHIDGAAVRALELFNMSYSQMGSSDGTLFGVLNKCKTAAGQRLLRDWIARPLCDLRLLRERQDVIAAIVSSDNERSTLRDALLPRVPDTAQISRKLLQGKGKLQDCYRIYQLICLLTRFEATIRIIYDKSDESSAIKEQLLEPVCYALVQFDKYVDLVNSTIDVKHYEQTGSFRIKPEIDPALLEYAGEMDELIKQFEQAKKKACGRLDIDTIKLDSNQQHGFFFRVTLKEEKNIRKVKDLDILATNKGSGVLFRDATMAKLNERYQELDKVYQRAQEELEKRVVETCAGYTVSLTQLGNALATVDVVCSLAAVAAESVHGYIRPILEPMGTGIFEIRGCRHPVLETSPSVAQFIPNDIFMDEDTRLIVLTGANMGGKSTYLRSAALCILLAQIGSFVPATSARFSLVDGIFTRVGASDQQTKGISTFMAEMLDSSSILQTATSSSLVIIDELGRGTSTFDGFGLAWAIASDLLKRTKCFCLFATHFHEMADLAQEPGAKAMQMTVSADNGQLSMLYEVRPGIATSSFGLEVAKMVGFSEDIIQTADRSLRALEDDSLAKLKNAKGEELRTLLLSL